MPVVALVPRDSSYERMMCNVEEVRARDGRLILVGHEGDRELAAAGRLRAHRPRHQPT